MGRALGKLHWIAIVSGIVYLISSLLYGRITDGTAHVFAARHVLICLMLALTLISQFGIIPRMDVLRASLGEVSAVPIDNPLRVQFDALHVWSSAGGECGAAAGIGCFVSDGQEVLVRCFARCALRRFRRLSVTTKGVRKQTFLYQCGRTLLSSSFILNGCLTIAETHGGSQQKLLSRPLLAPARFFASFRMTK